jgi:glycerol-3-phosphate dehydrogenase (NAD(P)+)
MGHGACQVLADNGEQVTLLRLASFNELVENQQNQTYLPGISLPDNVVATQNLQHAVTGKALVICAVPSHAVREVFAGAAAHFGPQALLLCGTKGLEESTLQTMAELFAEILGAATRERHGFLSGPTFAIEVARGLPAAVTVGAYSENVARRFKRSSTPPSAGLYVTRRRRHANRRCGEKRHRHRGRPPSNRL